MKAIDVNKDIVMKMIENSWYQDTLEYYGEYDDFYSLDFTQDKDVRYAINR